MHVGATACKELAARLANLRMRDPLAARVMVLRDYHGPLAVYFSSTVPQYRWWHIGTGAPGVDSAGMVKHPGIRITNRTSGYSTGGRLINRPGYASVRNIYMYNIATTILVTCSKGRNKLSCACFEHITHVLGLTTSTCFLAWRESTTTAAR